MRKFLTIVFALVGFMSQAQEFDFSCNVDGSGIVSHNLTFEGSSSNVSFNIEVEGTDHSLRFFNNFNSSSETNFPVRSSKEYTITGFQLRDGATYVAQLLNGDTPVDVYSFTYTADGNAGVLHISSFDDSDIEFFNEGPWQFHRTWESLNGDNTLIRSTYHIFNNGRWPDRTSLIDATFDVNRFEDRNEVQRFVLETDINNPENHIEVIGPWSSDDELISAFNEALNQL